MCGLVGVAGNITHTVNKMFRDLLVFDQVRGFDSTGMVFVPWRYKNQPKDMAEVLIHKEVGTPDQLFWGVDTHQFFDRKGIYKRMGVALIGHNRAATIGKVNQENAHPFQFDYIYGAHNGSLISWHEMEGYKDFDVDSMGIFKTIAEKGIEHTWKILHGAAALTWWDDETGLLNIIRNKERPLWYAWDDKRENIYWASEYQMIRAAAQRNNVKLYIDKSGIAYRQFEENTLYQFRPDFKGVKQEGEPQKLEARPFARSNTKSTGGSTSTTYSGPKAATSNKYYPKFERSWVHSTRKAGKSARKLRFHRPALISKYTHGSGCVEVVKFFPFNLVEDGLCDLPYFKNNAVAIELYPQSREELETISNEIFKYPNARYKFCGKVRESCDTTIKNLITLRTNLDGIERYYDGVPVKDNVIEMGNYNQSAGFKSNKDKLPDTFLGYLGKQMNQAEFEKALSNAGQSCAYCGTVFDLFDHDDIYWYDHESAICKECRKYELYRGLR